MTPHLVRQGVRVAIFSRMRPTVHHELTSAGALCIPIRSRGNHNPALFLEFVAAIRHARPQIIQTWLTQMDLLAGMTPLPQTKWVLSERSSPPAYPPTLKNRLRALLGRRSDIVVANSPSGIQVWPDANRTTVISNGIESTAFDAIQRRVLCDAPPLKDRQIILSVARLSPEKRLGILIDAIALLRLEFPQILLVLLGEGEERERLTRRVKEQDLGRHVLFAGFRFDAPMWFRSADLFASASRFEGQPNAVLEAAAAGVPSVLSDIAEHRHTMGHTARYVSSAEPEAFAIAIAALLRSDADQSKLATLARQRVESASFEAVAGAYAELYQALLSEQGKST